jgi:biopolymer transport protein ExbD
MIKRRTKAIGEFSMSSMTDIIFLLLIFFMITSTVVMPNAIKVLLPQGKEQTSAKPMARLTIDDKLNYYAAWGKERDRHIQEAEITPFLLGCREKDSTMYVALYADETVPYAEIVKLLNIANENKFKMVFMTRQPEE